MGSRDRRRAIWARDEKGMIMVEAWCHASIVRGNRNIHVYGAEERSITVLSLES